MKHEEIRQKPGIREYNRRKNKEKGKKKKYGDVRREKLKNKNRAYEMTNRRNQLKIFLIKKTFFFFLSESKGNR